MRVVELQTLRLPRDLRLISDTVNECRFATKKLDSNNTDRTSFPFVELSCKRVRVYNLYHIARVILLENWSYTPVEVLRRCHDFRVSECE